MVDVLSENERVCLSREFYQFKVSSLEICMYRNLTAKKIRFDVLICCLYRSCINKQLH